MTAIKVGVGTLNQTPLAWDANKRNILDAIAESQHRKISILCLPEMCITGYGCEDAFLAPGVQHTALCVLHEIVPETRNLVVCFSIPVVHNQRLYNCACLVADCSIVGFVAKQFLASEGIHYEPRWFHAWPQDQCDVIHIFGKQYPIGDLVFRCGGVNIGFEICEDAWVDQRPGHRLSARGVDLILNPSASHFAFEKHRLRERFVTEGSANFGVGYLYANLMGNEAGRIIYDGGSMIADKGQIVAQGPRLSFAPWNVTHAVLSFDTESNKPQSKNVARNTAFTFAFSPTAETSPPVSRPRWESSSYQKEEHFSRAIAISLFDYMRKSRSQGVVISASGGADSTACACLFRLGLQLAAEELGLGRVLEYLRYIPDLGDIRDIDALTNRLLLCVYQKTRNSSETTEQAARLVSQAIGAQFIVLDVDPLVEGYVQRISSAIGRELSWDSDDTALQNIQARVRAPSVWLLANLRKSLLLATSNRSEAAVGYATMDGDTAGGVSPIAGIDKAFLLQWLRWLQDHGLISGAPIPQLSHVTNQQPTAELRPASYSQTDEDDLMPYDILDAIERAAIGDKHMPVEVFETLRQQFPHHDHKKLGEWVTTFFRLWCQNQWKRERYAPSFHVDDKNLDPKTWCRFPILSGGFERELMKLRDLLSSL